MSGRGHERQRGAQHVEIAVDVHAQHRAPVVLGAVGEAGGPADAGDVHDRVQRPELFDQVGEQLAHRFLVGHRDVRRACLAPGVDDPLCRGGLGTTLAGRAVDRDPGIDGHDEHALTPELLGDRGTDADRTPGDDGDAHDDSSVSSANPSKSPDPRHSTSRSW